MLVVPQQNGPGDGMNGPLLQEGAAPLASPLPIVLLAELLHLFISFSRLRGLMLVGLVNSFS